MVLVDRLHPLRLLRPLHLPRPPVLVDLLGLDHRADLVDRLPPLRLRDLLDPVPLSLPDHQAHLLHQPGLADQLGQWHQLHQPSLAVLVGLPARRLQLGLPDPLALVGLLDHPAGLVDPVGQEDPVGY